jgi:hypothetical protein
MAEGAGSISKAECMLFSISLQWAGAGPTSVN